MFSFCMALINAFIIGGLVTSASGHGIYFSTGLGLAGSSFALVVFGYSTFRKIKRG